MNIPDSNLAKILGAGQANVTLVRTGLESAFTERDCLSDNVMIGALATVRVECPPFNPIHEYGTDEYFRMHYDITGNAHLAGLLGNDQPGDGIRYAGRGLIQLTGKSNYRKYGEQIGIDLVENPDDALRMDVACKVFALYFEQTGCVAAANAGEWIKLRRLVNGGANGMQLFMSIVAALSEAISTAVPPRNTL